MPERGVGASACRDVLGHFFPRQMGNILFGVGSEGWPGWFVYFLGQLGNVEKTDGVWESTKKSPMVTV